jgi:hypothetical protein
LRTWCSLHTWQSLWTTWTWCTLYTRRALWSSRSRCTSMCGWEWC